MTRLEYRMLDEERGYPILFYYDNIDKDEMAMRICCDYFVKNNLVYEKVSCAAEVSSYIIYVSPAVDEMVVEQAKYAGSKHAVRVEVREFKEDTAMYPVLHTFEFPDPMDALLHLQSDRLFLQGREWMKTSAEVDEDREVYVYYVKPSE